MFFVYILQSEKTLRFYVGSSQDFQDRLIEHNRGFVRSTKHGIPWKIIHTESFNTRAEAYRKERKIKARGIKRYLIDIGKMSG
ncbi:MAG: GIY-YIG nuclease family protein [Calditrichaeota bacterium]|nr:GIY-YIG nuclease family protein [Calditrichota bacterium]